jgi:MFS family permease
MRTSVAEMVPSETLQAKAFAFLPTAAGLGTSLGPAVGGSLAHAFERYPILFWNMSVLSKHPFAMPAMIAAMLFLMAFATASISLQESRTEYHLITNHHTDDMEDDHGDENAIDLDKSGQQGLRDGDLTVEVRSNKLRHISNVTIWINAICGLHSVAFDHMLPVFLHHSNDRLQFHSWIRFASGFGKGKKFHLLRRERLLIMFRLALHWYLAHHCRCPRHGHYHLRCASPRPQFW